MWAYLLDMKGSVETIAHGNNILLLGDIGLSNMFQSIKVKKLQVVRKKLSKCNKIRFILARCFSSIFQLKYSGKWRHLLEY